MRIIISILVLLGSLSIHSCQRENGVDGMQSTTTDSLLGLWNITDGYLEVHDIAGAHRDSLRHPGDLAADAYLKMDADSSFLLYEQASSQYHAKFYVDSNRVIRTLGGPGRNIPGTDFFIRKLEPDNAIIYVRMLQSNADTVWHYHWVLSR